MLELLFVIHRMMFIHPILWKIGEQIILIYGLFQEDFRLLLEIRERNMWRHLMF